MSEEAAPVEVVEPQVEEGAVEPEVPAWRKALEEAPIDELREHPRFKGTLGSELETRRQTWQQEWQERESQRIADEAAAKQLEELRDLAKNDPDKLAERFLSDDEKRQRQQEIASLRSGTRDQIARQIGQAYRAMPEWSELTAADHEEFFKALAGKSDDEALAVFNRVAAEKIAEVRARKSIETYVASDREKVAAAVRQELQMESLQNGDRPGIGRTRGNGSISDEPNWRTEPQKWEAWYARQATGSRR